MCRESGRWVAVLSLAMGCNASEPPPRRDTGPQGVLTATERAAVTPRTPAAEARRVYQAQCLVCHGQHGAGDGPGAAALDPKPRSLRDGAWQASASDDRIRKVILGGGPAVGLSPVMPGYPALKTKPAVTEEMILLIRSFKE